MGYNLIFLPTLPFCSGYDLAYPCNWSQKLQQEYNLAHYRISPYIISYIIRPKVQCGVKTLCNLKKGFKSKSSSEQYLTCLFLQPNNIADFVAGDRLDREVIRCKNTHKSGKPRKGSHLKGIAITLHIISYFY